MSPTKRPCVWRIRECIYLQRDSWRTSLSDDVEGDDVHVKGGQQGREVESREPRERGLSQRGRGTYDGDRPLVVLWVARDGPELILELQSDAGKQTLFRSAFQHIEPDTRIDTDSWQGYNLLERLFDHETVTHDETYVTDNGVHCNTAEAEWSLFKPWWRQFRGVAKRNIHRYLAHYEFQRRHRYESRLTRVESMLGFLYADWFASSVTDIPLFSTVS